MTSSYSMVLASLIIISLWLSGCADEQSRSQKMRTSLRPTRVEQPKGLEDSLAALRLEIASLKHTQTQLGQSLRAMQAELAQARTTVSQTSSNCLTQEEVLATEDPSDSATISEGQFATAMDELDRQLAREPEDPQWSQQTESAIASSLQSVEGSRLLGVECRATRCQLELLHTDIAAQEQLLAHFPQESPFDGERIVRALHDDPEAPRTIVYVARAGHSLLPAF